MPICLRPELIRSLVPGVSTLPKSLLLVQSLNYISARYSPPTIIQTCHRNARFAATAVETLPGQGSGGVSFEHGRFQTNKAVMQPPTQSRRDADAWIALFDQFLPAELGKFSSEYDRPSADLQGTCHDIVSILYQARQQYNLDLLVHLGTRLGRWPALLWLVGFLLDNVVKTSPQHVPQSPCNINYPGSLDDLTSTKPELETEIFPRENRRGADADVDTFSTDPQYSNQMGRAENRDGTMEQIWQSLGCLILEAADLPAEEAYTTMSHVYQILAQLHHCGFIPHNIYAYDLSKDPYSLRRPPTIHLLSSRILNTLSDAAWRAHEKEVVAQAAAAGAQYSYLGFEVPGTRYKLKIRELGFEVWLDFVLWCCIEGGFAKETTWILEQMRERTNEKRWSVVSWDTVEALSPDGSPKASRVDWDRVRDRTGGVVGRIEGYSNDRPFVEIGDRTICSEVVLATIDGLINTTKVGVGTRGNSVGFVQERIGILKSILDRDNIRLKPGYLNSLVVRILESQGIDPEVDPASLQRLLKLSPMHGYAPEFDGSRASFENDLELLTPEYILNRSAITLGLFHRTIDAFSKLGNVGGAIDVFVALQSAVDGHKTQAVRSFAQNLKQQVREREYLVPRLLSPVQDVSRFYPQLPIQVLVGFLEILADAQVYGFGTWLLFSTDVDGPLIAPTMYGHPQLAPSLLRYAASTADHGLVIRIVEAIEVPAPAHVLRALLECKIVFHDFGPAEDLLYYLKDENAGGWRAPTVATLAAEVLRLEHRCLVLSENSATHQELYALDRAQSMLRKLLSGAYNLSQDPSLRRSDYSERKLKSFSRIFDSIPGDLQLISQETHVVDGPRADTVLAQAFNILLSAIVETRGSQAGKNMWDLWCFDPEGPEAQKIGEGGVTSLLYSYEMAGRAENIISSDGDVPFEDDMLLGEEQAEQKLVVPDLRTLRIIARSALDEDRRNSTATNHTNATATSQVLAESPPNQGGLSSILDWAVSNFRKFRLTEKEIAKELDGYPIPKQTDMGRSSPISRWKKYSDPPVRRSLLRNLPPEIAVERRN